MHTTTIEAQSHSASLAQSTATTGRSSLSGGCHSYEHNTVIFLLSQLVCTMCSCTGAPCAKHHCARSPPGTTAEFQGHSHHM